MKKKLLALVSATMMITATLTGCGGEEKTETPEEIVYLDESEIDGVFSNPDEYKGKYVKLGGQLVGAPEKDGETIAIQVWHDVINVEQNFVAYTDTTDGIESEDYVWVEGKIDGMLSGENMFGATVECPMIVDAKVTKGSYMEVVTPTISEIAPAVSQDQNDMSQTLYNDPGINELSYEVMAGTSSSGTVIFPAIEQNVPFQFILPDSYSDNYDLTFTNYTIDIPAE